MKRKQDFISMSPPVATTTNMMILSTENKRTTSPLDDNSPAHKKLWTSQSPTRLREVSQPRKEWQHQHHQQKRKQSLQIDTNSYTNGYQERISFRSNCNHQECAMEVPPSPCATSTTSAPPTPPGSIGSYSAMSFNSSTGKVLPSSRSTPRKCVVDPQYATRLQREMDDALLMPPPSVFRSPYSTGGDVMGDGGEMCMSNYSTPVNSVGGLSCLETPVCTPDTKWSRGASGGREESYLSSSSTSSSSFAFYTPKRRSPGGLVVKGNISNATPVRSNALSAARSPRNMKQSLSPASDRFIPSRATSNLNFSVWNSDWNEEKDVTMGDSDVTSTGDFPRDDDGTYRTGHSNTSGNVPSQPALLNMLLRSEVLGENIDPTRSSARSGGAQFVRQVDQNNGNSARSPLTEGGNFLRYNGNQRQAYMDNVFGDVSNHPTAIVDSFSLSPIRMSSNQLLMSMPQKSKRKIAKVPFKVLDAPALADDFYLNLVDWSSQNVLAVGLGSCVYLWNACTSKVTKLCDLSEMGNNRESAKVTSVSWTQKGTHLAVGVSDGELQFWDATHCKMIRSLGGHSARIGALSWCGPTLASGSRDRLIYLRDMRVQQPFTAKMASHRQEVCGLKWSFDEPYNLASGGNDNKLLVWDIKNHRQEVHRFSDHTAAVKAITWSPHQHGLLASGGGTADRCIRFWNALSGSALNAVDTGSQVCNLAWSQNCNEIVSTHGYSLNQIALWKYPTMEKVATLTGHTYRVLYLAMSPDGSSIVTGAGDETLRFWQVFPGPRSQDKNSKSGLLFPSSPYSILR